MKKYDTKRIAIFGLVAAVYVVLTVSLSFMSYGGIQFRIAEALTLLCFYKKDYIIPLTLGCAIANLFSPMLALDVPFGTLATLISLLLIIKSKNIYIASLMPVVINAVVVAIELKIAFNAPIWLSMLQVAAGEFACVSVIGVILFKTMERNPKIIKLIKFE